MSSDNKTLFSMLFNFKSVADYEALIKSQESLGSPPLFSVGPDFPAEFQQVLNKLSQLDPSCKGLDFINQVLDREVALQTVQRVLNSVSPPSTPEVPLDSHLEIVDDAIDNIRQSVPVISPRINIFDGELDSEEISQVSWGESERFPCHPFDHDDSSCLVSLEPKSAGKQFVSSVGSVRQFPYPKVEGRSKNVKDRPLFYPPPKDSTSIPTPLTKSRWYSTKK